MGLTMPNIPKIAIVMLLAVTYAKKPILVQQFTLQSLHFLALLVGRRVRVLWVLSFCRLAFSHLDNFLYHAVLVCRFVEVRVSDHSTRHPILTHPLSISLHPPSLVSSLSSPQICNIQFASRFENVRT